MYQSVHFNLILPKVKATGVKQVLGALVDEIAPRVYLPKNILLKSLLENEMNASSGTENGLAIPHIKINGVAKRFVTLATLDKPVDFGAADNVDSDIICLLVSPESDGPIHLRGLSRVTRMLQNQQLQRRLRETDDIDIIRSLLANPEGWLLAA